MNNNNHIESIDLYETKEKSKSQKIRKRREKPISENQTAICDIHRKKRPR